MLSYSNLEMGIIISIVPLRIEISIHEWRSTCEAVLELVKCKGVVNKDYYLKK